MIKLQEFGDKKTYFIAAGKMYSRKQLDISCHIKNANTFELYEWVKRTAFVKAVQQKYLHLKQS